MVIETHVNTAYISAYFQQRNMGRTFKFLTTDDTKLDYCNSLLVGISDSTLSKLQRVRNTAARILTNTSCHDHIVLKELHWLPVYQRNNYNILVNTYKSLHGQCPQYIRELLTLYTPTRDLRSNNALTLVVPRTRTVIFGNTSFIHAAPRLSNALSSSLQST